VLQATRKCISSSSANSCWVAGRCPRQITKFTIHYYTSSKQTMEKSDKHKESENAVLAFLPCDALHASIVHARPSVRLLHSFVGCRPCQNGWICYQTFSPPPSSISLVSLHHRSFYNRFGFVAVTFDLSIVWVLGMWHFLVTSLLATLTTL